VDKPGATFYRPFVPAGGTSAAKTPPEFRSWLRQLREHAGLTQDELAAAVGTDRRNIRRWEVDGHDPSGSMLLRVLAALGIEFAQALPNGVPGAVTSELRELRQELADAKETEATRHDAILSRLDAQLSELRALSARLAETSARRE
jgi:transcriptional regulator with XRE-family HTH domain